MKKITISDMTLTEYSASLSFKEKIEIARCLNSLNVDVIYMPKIENVKADTLLIRTAATFIKNSTLCVDAGATAESARLAASTVSGVKNSRIAVRLPVSPIQMEYVYHKKPKKMLELAKEIFEAVKDSSESIELYAEDATRAEISFLRDIINLAVEYGVNTVTLCDDEGSMLPDELAGFISKIRTEIPVLDKINMGVVCRSTNGMASASAIMAIKAGAGEIKCCVGGDDIPRLDVFAKIISGCGDRCGIYTDIDYNTLSRTTKQIEWIKGAKGASAASLSNIDNNGNIFDSNDSKDSITEAVKKLGYDLSEDDYTRVYEEFKRVAEKKSVTAKDLDALVSSVALQVPPTYRLVSYVINNGNIISSSAQIKLEKNGKAMSGTALGDGPVDAAFRTLEQIIGYHFELDDFQIQSVTEGREAMGFALVKLRDNGKLYSGNGTSTDIMEASIKAYINAVNKAVYEEEI